MNIVAKLTELLPLQTGTGKNGQWRKQDIIVETTGQYSKKICISIWGDNIDETLLIIGKTLDISYDLESRKFNEKWYTDVKARKINLSEPVTSSTGANSYIPNESINEQDDDDILPF